MLLSFFRAGLERGMDSSTSNEVERRALGIGFGDVAFGRGNEALRASFKMVQQDVNPPSIKLGINVVYEKNSTVVKGLIIDVNLR